MGELFDPLEKIRSALSSLEGTQVQGDTRSGEFIIHVNDKQKWNSEENLQKLGELFGKMVRVEYDPEQKKPIIEQMSYSFHDADRVYVEAYPGGVAAFFVLQCDEDNPEIAIVRDVVSARDARGVYFFKMLREICADESIAALVGFTVNPILVKTVELFAQRAGYATFFGNSGKDCEDVKNILKINSRYMQREGLLTQEIEPGIYVSPPEILAQITKDKLREAIGESDRLFPAFQHILDLQKEYTNGETVTGAFTMIMNRKHDGEKEPR